MSIIELFFIVTFVLSFVSYVSSFIFKDSSKKAFKRVFIISTILFFTFLALTAVLSVNKDSINVLKACQTEEYKCTGKMFHKLCLDHPVYGKVCSYEEIPKEAFE